MEHTTSFLCRESLRYALQQAYSCIDSYIKKLTKKFYCIRIETYSSS
ncbi:unnamed protein product [Moneuplotes crassus]|uniref:Uncharacterized protein n=1 Tax=Euplotes crassus TaxID=5936 RepID=A0AAD1U093_EUPCR|nr:unnamed protein product [Moneuplotes crassus]